MRSIVFHPYRLPFQPFKTRMFLHNAERMGAPYEWGSLIMAAVGAQAGNLRWPG